MTTTSEHDQNYACFISMHRFVNFDRFKVCHWPLYSPKPRALNQNQCCLCFLFYFDSLVSCVQCFEFCFPSVSLYLISPSCVSTCDTQFPPTVRVFFPVFQLSVSGLVYFFGSLFSEHLHSAIELL